MQELRARFLVLPLLKIIEQHINEPEKMLAALKVFVQPMKAATRS